MATHILFETASGYAIFEVKLRDELASMTGAVQTSIQDLGKFKKMVSLLSFSPFKNAAHALENANDVSEGTVNEDLRALLELNLSKPSKSSSIVLGISDPILASAIKGALKLKCDTSESTAELIRGIRFHAPKLLKGLQSDDLTKAQLGLGHSYSRSKLKFNVNRVDNMIIQAIALLDQLDKDVNLFSMRIREWYGYHFPELVKIVPDNYEYARAARFIGAKETLTAEKLPDLAALLGDDTTRAQNVIDAAAGSMGSILSEIDMLNISAFATRVVSIADYRKSLTSYLAEKMNLVAPSLTALLGERIGARLISHAGSLTNLSKYPASTVQILGAEKALFRALKTKGNTPKYGLIYHSSFIGRAGPKHKGRISRFLANKCSIASRIDCFSETPTPKFGEALRQQVEERLLFFEKGKAPGKNADAIRKVLDQLSLEKKQEDQDMADATEPVLPLIDAEPTKKKDKKKKRKLEELEMDGDESSEGEPVKKVKLSKEEKKALKKEKKREHKEKEAKEATEVSRAPVAPPQSLFAYVRAPLRRRRKKTKGKRKRRIK
ncbi:Nop-domain-containing protein [Lactarius pseudohatsudake]|nr:Nop-domain-containing protein [Lactarius pseudohatsudake]